MQAPQFLDQYTQRLGGFYQAQVKHLEQYQNIANTQYDGKLEKLISEFYASNRESVQQTARAIEENRSQVYVLQSELHILENGHFAKRATHLMSNIRMDIAKETIRIFTPGMPFTIEALVCGLLGGILLSALFNIVTRVPKIFKRNNHITQNVAPRRIEPSVSRGHSVPHKAVSRAV